MNRSVVYVQYTNPSIYAPLRHSSMMLAEKGFHVYFLATGAFQEADQATMPPHRHICVKKINFCPPGWRQKIHYLFFLLWVFYWVLRWRSQWVYCSDPLSCPIGYALSFLPGVRIIYHEHDSPPLTPNGLLQRLVLYARRRLAKKVTVNVLPNPERQAMFASSLGLGPDKIMLVMNCPPKADVISERKAGAEADFWIAYHGSLVPSRLPTSFFKALSLLPEAIKVKVIGYQTTGHAHYGEALKDLCSKQGMLQRVRWIGFLEERSQMLAECVQCDMGLSLMPKQSADVNEVHMAGASSKTFEYLACGLPVLVSDLPAWKKLFVDPGYGLACDPEDAKDIAEKLLWFYENRDKARAMGEKGRQRIATDWNYEHEFAPLADRMMMESVSR